MDDNIITQYDITQAKLDNMIAQHEKWLETNGCEGKQLYLLNLNLHGLYMSNYNLDKCIIIKCILTNKISNVSFKYATIRNNIFGNCKIQYCNFFNALLNNNFIESSFKMCNFSFADMRNNTIKRSVMNDSTFAYTVLGDNNITDSVIYNCDFDKTYLGGSNLYNTYFKDNLNFEKVETNLNTLFYEVQCPLEGSFIGYKKAGDCIVKLLIPDDALRSSATSKKCRCSKAKVLSITDLEGNPVGIDSVESNYTHNFIYKVGEMVEVNNFDTNRWNECSTGIHFFMSRNDAVKYP